MQGQMAAVTNMHVLVKTRKKLHLAGLNSDAVDCPEQAMLETQPELAQHEWCLRVMLADYPAIPRRQSQESFMKDLPNVHHGVVRSQHYTLCYTDLDAISSASTQSMRQFDRVLMEVM